MSKSIDVLAKELADELAPTVPMMEDSIHNNLKYAYKAGYKQRSDELIDLLVELEEYFEKRQDADWEGEETGMVPNKEMWFYAQIKEVLDKL